MHAASVPPSLIGSEPSSSTRDDDATDPADGDAASWTSRALVAALAVLVIIAGTALTLRRPESGPREFGVLVAPVTESDLDAAALADAVGDAMLELRASGESLDLEPAPGSGTSFGVLDGDQDPLVRELIVRGDIDLELAVRVEGSGAAVFTHRCADETVVVAESTVASDDADLAWWETNACDLALAGFVTGPLYLIRPMQEP